jgi:uncharacterized membrane protein YphA (DoxX/SURF4 family)
MPRDDSPAGSLVSLVLRLAAASLFAANAIGKFMAGSSAMLGYFKSLFHTSWLPSVVVSATALTTPYLEALLAIWLLAGISLRFAWLASALYMIILAFGMVVAQQYDVAAHNYLYVLLFCVGLYFSDSDRVHIRKQ